MKKVAFVSGKGGVGKTSILASTLMFLKQDFRTICVDADVDTPNLHLLLGKEEELLRYDFSAYEKPVIDYDKCTGCGKCSENCNFNAIEWSDGKPVVNNFLCEGCKVCSLVCEEDAISFVKKKTGEVIESLTNKGVKLFHAELIMGETGSGKLVSELKKRAEEDGDDCELMIIDVAAGIGCPVISACRDVDYAVLIVEPTKASFNDMKRAWNLLKHFKAKAGIVVNKFDLNPDFIEIIEEFAEDEGIKVITKIPYDEEFINSLNKLEIVMYNSDKLKEIFKKISNEVRKNL